jgi:hypothetical protein
MSYTVKSITDDSVELWDGVSNVDPDWPGERHTMTVFVGAPHPFLVGDIVNLAVRLLARITPPGEEVVPVDPDLARARAAVDGTEYQWCSDEELLNG